MKTHGKWTRRSTFSWLQKGSTECLLPSHSNPHTNLLNVYIQLANKMGFQPKKTNFFVTSTLVENKRVGASNGILPHIANIDNRSATVLICKCSLLCNNIPIATNTCRLVLLWILLAVGVYTGPSRRANWSHYHVSTTFESELLCDWQSVSQYVLVSSPLWDLRPDVIFLQKFDVLSKSKSKSKLFCDWQSWCLVSFVFVYIEHRSDH
jgi:hypothetical protein